MNKVFMIAEKKEKLKFIVGIVCEKYSRTGKTRLRNRKLSKYAILSYFM